MDRFRFGQVGAPGVDGVTVEVYGHITARAMIRITPETTMRIAGTDG